MSFIRWSFIASFLIGIMVGAASLNLVIGSHLDRAQLEIERLSIQLVEKSEQITVLEATLAQHEELAITKIEVNVTFKDEKKVDDLNILEIEKIIKDLLKTIRGREVSTLDPVLIVNIVDGRSIQTSNSEFTVKVKSLLVSEKLIMHVVAEEKAKPVNKNKNGQE